ncbi:uncharacterized protein ACIQIH_007619 isoform 5-T5 [Cyanocitta cristata]
MEARPGFSMWEEPGARPPGCEELMEIHLPEVFDPAGKGESRIFFSRQEYSQSPTQLFLLIPFPNPPPGNCGDPPGHSGASFFPGIPRMGWRLGSESFSQPGIPAAALAGVWEQRKAGNCPEGTIPFSRFSRDSGDSTRSESRMHKGGVFPWDGAVGKAGILCLGKGRKVGILHVGKGQKSGNFAPQEGEKGGNSARREGAEKWEFCTSGRGERWEFCTSGRGRKVGILHFGKGRKVGILRLGRGRKVGILCLRKTQKGGNSVPREGQESGNSVPREGAERWEFCTSGRGERWEFCASGRAEKWEFCASGRGRNVGILCLGRGRKVGILCLGKGQKGGNSALREGAERWEFCASGRAERWEFCASGRRRKVGILCLGKGRKVGILHFGKGRKVGILCLGKGQKGGNSVPREGAEKWEFCLQLPNANSIPEEQFQRKPRSCWSPSGSGWESWECSPGEGIPGISWSPFQILKGLQESCRGIWDEGFGIRDLG